MGFIDVLLNLARSARRSSDVRSLKVKQKERKSDVAFGLVTILSVRSSSLVSLRGVVVQLDNDDYKS